MIREIQDEILRLKKEQDVCILAHSYVAREISEVADFVGDSYGLSVQAMSAWQRPARFSLRRRRFIWQIRWLDVRWLSRWTRS